MLPSEFLADVRAQECEASAQLSIAISEAELRDLLAKAFEEGWANCHDAKEGVVDALIIGYIEKKKAEEEAARKKAEEERLAREAKAKAEIEQIARAAEAKAKKEASSKKSPYSYGYGGWSRSYSDKYSDKYMF